jgi:DNA-binding PadR family transcriptional regulator
MPLLAELELRVMLGVLQRAGEAVATAVHEEIERRTGRRTSLGSVYITLDRLEDKGLLVSRESGTSAARGGRPRRVFKVTPAGVRAVKTAVDAVTRMQRGLQDVLGRA